MMHAITSRALVRAAASSRAAAARASRSTTSSRATPLTAIAAPHAFSSSSRQSADAHSSSPSSSGDEYVTNEGFSAPIWRNTFFLLIAGVVAYRLSEMQASTSSAHSSHVNADEHDDSEEAADTRPFLTRYIAYYTTPADVWKRRNAKHYELVKEEAEKKLFFQDAERPPVHRFRYPQTFEQASPHGLPVGAQVDLSDLKVKTENE
ncbi:hypothetical protein K437DRAFT_254787 [Tilletiaria anomala UBC 951]|uniref:Uncharacterized protein n=1 Tax=Tilletiaria anomala (strain ATCC 24038 / CBS 436.72 / UBC 951) TaxID=1037660 RepID=A0A066WL89_TILAU|nr:uncharacterized protein K437DRAFT_254787 [Tilletiaria anomala UBC 951]KDN51380.1 hypothetical protein K437DRAFT_254787 [Tilletiaria anomala UBC 951]